MTFAETYFGSWYWAVADMFKRRDTREIIKPVISSADKLEEKLRLLDSELQRYAVEWAKLSEMHRHNGVYREIAEFIGEPKGLLIDLGCGNGNFLAEWGNIPAVGVDLNGYCLQLAERNLKEKGSPVRRYSKSTLYLNPQRGFDLKALEGQVHLDGITLLTDDVTDLQMTKQAFAERETKADIVTFMLWGGRNPYETIHFLDPNAGSFDYKSALRLTKYTLMGQLPYILKSGGRFYLAVRMTPLAEQLISDLGTIEDMLQDLAQDSASLMKVKKIPLQSETGSTDIVVRHLLFGSDVGHASELQLAEFRLK